MQNSSYSKSALVYLLIFFYLTGAQSALCTQGELSLFGNSGGAKAQGTREYYAANPEDTPLINVQLWGDLGQPGIYHVPVGTTLRRMLGYIGGPLDLPSKTTIYISRLSPVPEEKSDNELHQISARDLMASAQWSRYELQKEDVIYLEGEKAEKRTTFFDVLKSTLVILGFVTSVLTTYLLIERVSR